MSILDGALAGCIAFGNQCPSSSPGREVRPEPGPLRPLALRLAGGMAAFVIVLAALDLAA